MATLIARITYPDAKVPATVPAHHRDGAAFVRNTLEAEVAGRESGQGLQVCFKETAAGVKATGTYTLSGSSGTITATIAGTGVSVAYATSDANTASLLKTAINANSTVNKLVVATVSTTTVTLTALEYSILGNQITTTASGTGLTATQAKLTGGVTPTYTTYV